jgi:hypothetical protein
MKKIVIIVSIVISSFLLNGGKAFMSQASVLHEEKICLLRADDEMDREIKRKRRLRKKLPVPITTSFGSLINLMRTLENYGGEKIELLLSAKKEKESLEEHFAGSDFRNVKSLPMDFKFSKFSESTQLAAVLNDIYLLERVTDFRVYEISDVNDILEVKGVLYGIQ